MAKIINLDELIPEKQFVILDGEQHEVEPVSVEVYMQVLQGQSRMKHASEEVAQINQAIELIKLCCPSIEEKRLKKLGLKALTALADMIQEQMEEGVDAIEDTSGEASATDAP